MDGLVQSDTAQAVDPSHTFERICRLATDAVTSRADELPDGIEMLAVGIAEIRDELKVQAARTREVLSVRSSVSAESIILAHDHDVALSDAGTHMVGLFDYDSTEPAARDLLASLGRTNYRYCRGAAGLQFKIFDRRCLVIPGPWIDGEVSALRVTRPGTVHTGVATFLKLVRGSFPVRSPSAPTGISPRQWRIAVLMANDLTDAAIAQRVGVSLRTVRSDIAGLLRILGVQSRFAAGLRLSDLGLLVTPQPAHDVRAEPRP